MISKAFTPVPYISKPIKEDDSEKTMLNGENDDPSISSDTIKRLRRLEDQNSQVLPILGQVAEAVSNLNVSLQDLKTDTRDIKSDLNKFRIETATYGVRIQALECFKEKHDSKREEYLLVAKEKAELTLDEQLKEDRLEKKERRNKIYGTAGTAIGSFIVAALLTWLGLK
jgi:DNA repair ATPase RecN